MNYFFSLSIILCCCFSQQITKPVENQSFEYEEFVAIKWDINNPIGDRATIYWSETKERNDWKKIEEINFSEGESFWEIEKSIFDKKSDGEIYIILEGIRGSKDMVKIRIDPIVKLRKGNITFTSGISNVEVLIDGKIAGTTPFTKKDVPWKDLKLTYRKEGYKSRSESYTHNKKSDKININLSKPIGTLRVIVEEMVRAKIEVNNQAHYNLRKYGGNRLTLNTRWKYISSSYNDHHQKLILLPIGQYTVEATAPLRMPFSKQIRIREGQVTTLPIDLQRQYGKLSLKFNVRWGLLQLSQKSDNEIIKLNSQSFKPFHKIDYGQHEFYATAPKYEPLKFTVNINSPDLISLNKGLIKKTKKVAIQKNLLFPGMLLPGSGQLYSENRRRGFAFMALHAILAYGIYTTYTEYDEYSSQANIFKEKYDQAVTTADLQKNWNAYQSNANKANDASKAMLTISSVAAANWIGSLFDSLFFSGLD